MLGLYSHGGYAYLIGFIALVPWLLVLNTISNVAGAARSGLVMSIVFVAAVFAWFGVAIGAYTGIGSATGLFVVLLAAPLLQPQIFAFALVRHITGRRYGALVRALAGASAWVAVEWLVPKLLGDTIGHGLYPSPYLRQIADIGGAAGLTFLLILVNESIAFAITHRRNGARALVSPLLIAASILILMAAYGSVRLSALSAMQDHNEKPLRVGMVQSNIVDYESLRREMGAYEVVRHVLDTHYAMSHEAIDQHHVDALLWSETVYPTTFGHPKSEGGAELDKEIRDFVTAAKVPLVFGTYDLDESGEYNATAFVEPNVGTLGFYRKTDLFLFTEYLPAWFDGPAARRLLPWAGGWKQGSGARVFPLRLADGREIPVLPMICLDDVDTNLGIDGARLGAQVILSMSNDSWFTEFPVGAKLHQTVAAFRSIETRMPQMRVTANGISSVIDATGKVVTHTAMSEQKILIGEVSAGQPPMTLMVAWGDWLGRVGLAFLMLLAMISIFHLLKRRMLRGISASSASTLVSEENFQADGVVFSFFWRAVAGSLRVFAWAGLLWIGMPLIFGDNERTNALMQMWMFAALVLAPEVALWSIKRALSAKMRIENGMLVLEQRERRIEISVKEIEAVEAWKFPLPCAGVSLRLGLGQQWSGGIALADQAAFVRALIRAGAQFRLEDSLATRTSTYARVRQAVPRWRLDHPIIKFVLFPLVPALPAFRLHQNIAFGGTFGEYYTFGLKAYLVAFVIWWASWVIGMTLFAALLRVVIETGTLFSIGLFPERAIDVRKVLEPLGRILFFLGVPVWLLTRIWLG
ncbi:MAG: apolipoprotein N-acyltransferase [Arenimonas sp.]